MLPTRLRCAVARLLRQFRVVSLGACSQACTLVLASGIRRMAGDGTIVEDIPMLAADGAETCKLVACYGEMGVRYHPLAQRLRNAAGRVHPYQLSLELLLTDELPVGQLVDAEICRSTPAPDNCRVSTTMDLE